MAQNMTVTLTPDKAEYVVMWPSGSEERVPADMAEKVAGNPRTARALEHAGRYIREVRAAAARRRK